MRRGEQVSSERTSFCPACSAHDASQRTTRLHFSERMRLFLASLDRFGLAPAGGLSVYGSSDPLPPILELGGSEEITSTETLSADGKPRRTSSPCSG
jgi:hypothetical protein